MIGYKSGRIYLEANGHYETTEEDKSNYILHGFGAYQAEWGRIGVEYNFKQDREKVEGEDDKTYDYNIFSIFVVYKAGEKFDVIGRYDKNFGEGYKTNFSGQRIAYIPFADNAESNLIIGAVSWNAIKNVWLIPNFKYVFYNEPDEGEKPGDDIYANLTLFFKF